MVLRVGFDADNSIIDTFNPFVRDINNEYGTEHELISGTVDYNLSFLESTLRRDPHHEVRDYILTKGDTIPFFPGASEMISNLTEYDLEIFIITARSPDTEENTLKCLEREISGCYDELVFTAGDCKSAAAKYFDLDIYVEDSPRQVEVLSGMGIFTFYMQFWNDPLRLNGYTTVVKNHDFNYLERKILEFVD